MLIALQALAFAGCALLDMLPSTEVQCRIDVPVVVWSAPPPAVEPAAADSSPVVASASPAPSHP
jgi:hypothetical protein